LNRIDKIQKVARETIETEYRAIKNLGESINEEFAGAVDVLFNMKGRVVVTGIGKLADFVLDVTVEKEACPNNLAPTASTTAQLVMGDALAISLLDLRGFSPTDFAKFHPGGALGKRMFLRVNELAVNNMAPKVHVDELISDVIIEISSKRLGATAVLDNNDHLVGVITDGDLRRMIQSHPNYQKLTAKEVMTHNPKTIQKDELVVDALHLMREKNITQLPVLDKDEYIGVIHLHDILKEGIL